jgi:hypothetical protein
MSVKRSLGLKQMTHGRPGKPVFNCGAGWKQLRRHRLCRDILVVRWKCVSLQTEGAKPHPGPHVDIRKGVEDGAAGAFA